MTSPNQKESSLCTQRHHCSGDTYLLSHDFAYAAASQTTITAPTMHTTHRSNPNKYLDYPRGYYPPTRRESRSKDRHLSHRYQSPHGHSSRDPRDTHHRRDESRGTKHHSHHDRNIAGGAIAGAGLAELVHHHHKKNGDHVSHGVGHFVRTVGAGALGAVAANELTKAHEAHRAKESRSHGGTDHDYYRR